MSNFVQLAVQGTNTEDCQIAIAIASRASGKLTAGGGGRLACFAKQQAGERGGYAHLAHLAFSPLPLPLTAHHATIMPPHAPCPLRAVCPLINAHYGALRALYAARFFPVVGGRSGMEIGVHLS
jgi:hypothetical protein